MANNILNTKSLIEELNQVWQKHVGYLDTASDAYQRLQTSAKLPSSYAKALKDQAKNQQDLVKSTEQLRKAEEKAQRERVKELKLYSKREKAFDKYERQLEREQRLLNRTQGLYNKVQRGINQVTKQYQDLALRKELNGKLSAEEEITLGKLEAKLNKYQSALKRVDANIGKHQRNVGNYKSGFDGLGFSIAQLSREMPAFANSMQTGFMAISNNIPMLVDEINKLKIANQQLSASGKPTVNILKQIGKSLFGWQTLISVGVTLLTVYGAKLFEWAFGMTEAEKATKKANEELEEQNKKLRENISLRNRQVKGIREFLDDPTLNAAFKGILMGEESERANLALIELSDRLQKIGAKNADVLKDQELSTQDRLNIAGNLLEIERQQGKLQKERLRIDEIMSGKKEGILNLQETFKIQARILQLEQANESLMNRKVEIETKDNKNRREKIKYLKLEKKGLISWRLEIQKQINILEKVLPLYGEYTKEGKYLREQIKALNTVLEPAKGQFDKARIGLEDWSDAFKKAQKRLKKLREETDSYLKGFSDEFIQSSPLGSLTTFFDGTFKALQKGAETNAEKFAVSFNAIAESAQQAFSFIDSMSQANFEAQYSRLEQQKNIAIQFAGESTTAQAEIERQYEERRKEIQNRQAKAQKDMALFNIGVDTAQAVIATLAQTPPPAGLPLAALVSAIGLAQLVAVQSKQIPQFWQGGEVGGMQNIIVNDDPFGVKGSNYKEVIEKPNGQILTPQGKNVKMQVPKGSYVHPTYEAFMNSLDQELISNNIMPVGQSNIMPMIINQGLTRSEVQSVMSEHGKSIVNAIRNKKEFQWISDEKGTRKYEIENSKRVRIMNSRYSGTGRDV